MSSSVAYVRNDPVVGAHPFAEAVATDAGPATTPKLVATLSRAPGFSMSGEDISSLLILVPIGLLALFTLGGMSTPLSSASPAPSSASGAGQPKRYRNNAEHGKRVS